MWLLERRKYSKATAIRKEGRHGTDVAREKNGGGEINIPSPILSRQDHKICTSKFL